MAAAPDDDARRTLAELEAKLRELERELLRGHPAEQAGQAEAAAQPEQPAPQPLAADAPPPAPGPPAAEAPGPPHPLATPPESHASLPEALSAGPFPEAPPSEHDALAPHGDPLGAAADHMHPEPFPEAASHEPVGADPDAAEPVPFPVAPLPAPLAAEPAAAPPEDAAEPEPPLPAEPPPPALDLDALADAHEVLAGLRTTVEEMEEIAGRITVEARTVIDGHGRSLGRLELAARAAARAEEAAAEAGRVAGTVVVEAGPFADPAPLLALRDALAAHPGTKDAYVRGVEEGRAVIEVHLAPPPA
jgi:hypothetical protein